MNDVHRPALQRLVKCLQDASECIEQVSDENELESVDIQLKSLKLILESNADALRLWINDGGNYHRVQAEFKRERPGIHDS